MRSTLPNCFFCGKWVGWKKPYYMWVPFGSVMDLEPPDDVFAHQRCWDAHADHQSLLMNWTWHKPQLVGGLKDEHLPDQ